MELDDTSKYLSQISIQTFLTSKLSPGSEFERQAIHLRVTCFPGVTSYTSGNHRLGECVRNGLNNQMKCTCRQFQNSYSVGCTWVVKKT